MPGQWRNGWRVVSNIVDSRIFDMLTKNEVKRYKKQISIFGKEGQRKLKI